MNKLSIIIFTICFIVFSAFYSFAQDNSSFTEDEKILIEGIEPDLDSQSFEDDLFEDSEFSEYETSEKSNKRIDKVFDPIEPVNRGIFYFNDKVYIYIFTPVAKGYKKATPKFARTGISNFFSNLGAPLRVVNNLLQGKIKNAGKETGSFFVNTLLGFFGVVDSAQTIEALHVNDQEDLGQTFGKWGIGPGPYLVIPFLGPSNLRDLTGTIGDHYFIDPVDLVYDPSDEVGYSMTGVDILNSMPGRMEMYKTLKDSALDPYTAARDGYNQLREAKIKK